ncbi:MULTISPECIES: hypothetical protein [Aphanothece]|uniref:hypothetical protein n=1 Tax=Aphanothece TaxID=1121 RepID=UPI003984A71B
MQQLRHQHGQRPSLLPQLRRQALSLLLALLVGGLSWAGPATAAELLQVRGDGLLQVGDGNRSYTVALACIGIDPADQAAANAWLREALPRRSRINLRPVGQADGVLLARVSRLGRAAAGRGELELGDGLIAAGLAHPLAPGPARCPQEAA